MPKKCTYYRCEHVLESRNDSGLCGACAFQIAKSESEVVRLWSYYLPDYNEIGNRNPVRAALILEFVLRAARRLRNRYTGTYVGGPNYIADLAYPMSREMVKSVWRDAIKRELIVHVGTDPDEWTIGDEDG